MVQKFFKNPSNFKRREASIIAIQSLMPSKGLLAACLFVSTWAMVSSFLPVNGVLRLRSSANGMPLRTRDVSVFGIPKLFRWLVDLYPGVVESVGKGLTDQSLSVDNFYLDMNGIIHQCTHANSDSLVTLTEKDMFIRIFSFTDRLYKLVGPRRLMFLAVDGVAPRAKMNQQRSRRFRASKEREQRIRDYIQQNGELPEREAFNSNCITPGTEFMHRLCQAFPLWIEQKMKTDPFWQHGAEVVFSGPNVPGEGEHKIMDLIRDEQSKDASYVYGQRTHCMYGLDADLIMLSLATHETHFVLLREKLEARRQMKDTMDYEPQDFEVLEITLLRKLLNEHFHTVLNAPRIQPPPVVRVQQQQQQQSLPAETKHQRASESEPTSIATEIQRTYPIHYHEPLNRVIDDFIFMCFFVGNDFLPNLPHLDIAFGALNSLMDNYRKPFRGYLTYRDQLHLPRIELLIQAVAQSEADYFRRRAEEDDEPMYATEGYKDFYYETKFGLAPDDLDGRRRIVRAYVEGLAWVARYYHDGCGSWTWFYPYLYAPLASDLVDLASLAPLTFEEGRPFTPLLQLLSVLPPQSSDFLPKSYAEMMTHPLSPVSSFYPSDFDVDPNGKHQSWESVVQIPFIDAAQLMQQVGYLNHSRVLTAQERARNRMGQLMRFPPPAGGAAHAQAGKKKAWRHKSHTDPMSSSSSSSSSATTGASKGWGNVVDDRRVNNHRSRPTNTNHTPGRGHQQHRVWVPSSSAASTPAPSWSKPIQPASTSFTSASTGNGKSKAWRS